MFASLKEKIEPYKKWFEYLQASLICAATLGMLIVMTGGYIWYGCQIGLTLGMFTTLYGFRSKNLRALRLGAILSAMSFSVGTGLMVVAYELWFQPIVIIAMGFLIVARHRLVPILLSKELWKQVEFFLPDEREDLKNLVKTTGVLVSKASTLLSIAESLLFAEVILSFMVA